MNDVAKCQGVDCPQRDTCWRQVVEYLPLMRYGSWDADRQRNGGPCDGYWPIKQASCS